MILISIASFATVAVKRLPDLALLLCRPHHRIAGFAVERLLKFGQIAERAVHAPLTDRMRIGEHHLSLRLWTDRVAARLSPRDEELLLGCETLHVRRLLLAGE